MAGLALPLAIAAGVGLLGSVVTAGGKVYEGQQAKDAAYTAAAQEEALGKNEFAASQRDAREQALQGELVMSRQQAAAAASGGGAGADDPTIIRLMTETGKRSEYAQEVTRYGGLQRRTALFDSAAARRKTGDSSYIGGVLGALGSIAGGVGTFAARTA